MVARPDYSAAASVVRRARRNVFVELPVFGADTSGRGANASAVAGRPANILRNQSADDPSVTVQVS